MVYYISQDEVNRKPWFLGSASELWCRKILNKSIARPLGMVKTWPNSLQRILGEVELTYQVGSWITNVSGRNPGVSGPGSLNIIRPPTSQDLSDRVEKWVKHFFTFFSTCLDLTLPKSYSTVPERNTDLHWSYMDDFSFSRFHFWGNEDYSHKKCLNWSKQGSLHRFKRNLHQDFPLCHRLVETTTVPDMPSSCSLELLAFADPRF